MTTFPIPKQTGTHADVFAVVGLAELLSRCGIHSELLDQGSEYQVVVSEPVTAQKLRQLGNDPGYRYLVPNDKERAKIPPAVGDRYFDYPKEKERFDRWKEHAQQLKNASGEIAEGIEAPEPDPDFLHYRILNLVQGDGPLNKAAVAILRLDSDGWHKTLEQALVAIAARRPAAVGFDTDLVQLFSPLAAKGYARLKPDSTSRNDKTKDDWADPFFEWLRFRGFFLCSVGFLLDKDIRLITVEPARISYPFFRAVMDKLRGLRLGGANVKVDCLGTLAIARILIQHGADFEDEFGEPSTLLSGVLITHYQSLGQAKAVTNLSRLSLPGWYSLDRDSEEDKARWGRTLDEHITNLRRLNDKFSDELQLLVLYRRHLEHRSKASALWLAEFLEAYGIFLIRKRGEDDWRLRQFDVSSVESIMDRYYSSVLNNPGFQAVGRALRSATVTAQTRKRNRQDVREIRYDILPELRRKRSLPKPDEFLDAIADFVASYNAESAKRLEQGKKSGISRVSEPDFAEFVSLFEPGRSPAIVGALLCAWATCKAGNETDAQQPDINVEN